MKVKFLAFGVFMLSAVIGAQVNFSLPFLQLAALGGSEITPAIKITKPTTAVTWQTEINKTITWESFNIPDSNPIFIRLFDESGRYIPEANGGLAISQSTNADHTQTVIFSRTLPYGKYFLELDTASVNGVDVTASRTGLFYLTPRTYITFKFPPEGAVWPINSSQEIIWTANVPGAEDLKLEKLDASGALIGLAIITPNDGKHLIPIVSGPVGQFRYRLTYHSSDPNAQDIIGVSGLFSIVLAQTGYHLDISEPKSTDGWIPGTQRYVRWTTDLPESEKFKLERIRVNDGMVVATNANLPNTGAFLVTVIPSTAGQFKYKLSPQYRPDPVVTSENFTIGSASLQTPVMTITSDLFGKQYLVGGLVKLTWTTNSAIPVSSDTSSTVYPRMTFQIYSHNGSLISDGLAPMVQGGNDDNQTVTLGVPVTPGDYYIQIDPIMESGSTVDVPAVKTGVFTVISSVTPSATLPPATVPIKPTMAPVLEIPVKPASAVPTPWFFGWLKKIF